MKNLSRRERERLTRETEILDAAEKIFARDGYDNASMNEIAKEAEFSKRTLYQYFEDKTDLYLTVALRLYKSISSHFENLDINRDTGYEMAREMFFGFYDFYKNNESTFRIIYDIGNVRKKTVNPKLNEFLEINRQISQSFQSIIVKGQQDGSISKAIDPKTATSVLIFVITGFLNQLTISGRNYSKHLNMEMDEFASHALNLLHSVLK